MPGVVPMDLQDRTHRFSMRLAHLAHLAYLAYLASEGGGGGGRGSGKDSARAQACRGRG